MWLQVLPILLLLQHNCKTDKITGVDLSEGMLKVGKQKIQKSGLEHLIELQKADSESLPFENTYSMLQ
jgi:ubiquinone/menaquinone biosynthesis C-methylase UbiE